MSMSPLAYADSLRIGSVDFISPNEIKVLLDIETPDAVALNTGMPRSFPRINSYVLIPCEQGHLVAQVEWITVERSQYPKRRGMQQDFGLLDLPYPLRKMSLNPLGILCSESADKLRFKRGVESYPTVGDPVLLPTEKQLRSIVESGKNRHVRIGTSPLANDAEVSIDPDRLFGRHLAVLGNTGSGKSCSVAGLIRWSLEAAKRVSKEKNPNARFIILDPNGEYANTFTDLDNVRVFKVEAKDKKEQLQVPLWFWNSAEWCAFTEASSKTQRPTLIQALCSVRDGIFKPEETPSHAMRRYLRTFVTVIKDLRNKGEPFGEFAYSFFYNRIPACLADLKENDKFSPQEKDSISRLRSHLEMIRDKRTIKNGRFSNYPFENEEINQLLSLYQNAYLVFGGRDKDCYPIDADIPKYFTGEQLLQSVEANAEMLNVSEYVETMLTRIRTILSDSRMKTITGDTEDLTLEDWLKTYIGDNDASNGAVTVIDLSLVPAEVVSTITAVIARMTLEALQRYRKLNNGKTLPTVLVMEEAHTFIRRYRDDSENQSSSAICCQVFEKIAREGRKFGLGLVLSSQRPSELSPTVLSQCNSYLLHRISNDRDQELVAKLVPDNLRGLLRDLPSLPSQHAVLLGWASELPILVKMNNLNDEQRPKSDDPDFWDVWSGKEERSVNWKEIADDWQHSGNQMDETVIEDSEGEQNGG